jgi:nitroreductase
MKYCPMTDCKETVIPLQISDFPLHSQSTCYDTILNRKSTRSFSNKPVPETVIFQILEAARWAPSAKNRQPWFYTVIRTIDAISMISDCLIEAANDRTDILKTAKIIRSVPILILVETQNESQEQELPDTLSIGASIENLLLAATELGLSSLWICDILDVKNEIKAKLGLKYRLVSAICIGYQDGNGKTPRNTIEEMVDWR